MGMALPPSISARLIEFHVAHGQTASVTAARLPGRFGAMQMIDASVRAFIEEKPMAMAPMINGGFFVLSSQGRSRLASMMTSTDWERQSLVGLSYRGPIDGLSSQWFLPSDGHDPRPAISRRRFGEAARRPGKSGHEFEAILGAAGGFSSPGILALRALGCRCGFADGCAGDGLCAGPAHQPSLFELANVGTRLRHIVADVRDLGALKAALRDSRAEIVIHMAAQALWCVPAYRRSGRAHFRNQRHGRRQSA